MINKINLNVSVSGFILPTALFFMISSLTIITIYFSWLHDKKNQLEYRIAAAKATYNAESGIAEKAYPYLLLSSFEKDTTLQGRSLNINFASENIKMGSYKEVEMSFNVTTSERMGSAIGVATWGINGKDTLYRKANLSGSPETLGKYMYFTDTEKAGGAPFSFGPPGFGAGERRRVKFYNQDIINGVIQTNDEIYFSGASGCPNFSDATWYLTPGNPGPADWGSCGSWNQLFQGSQNIDTTTVCKLKFPPPGYETLKNNATFIYDAGIKINSGIKDTLVMTDIEFFDDSRFRVRQWWYLMPPHLRPGINNSESTEPYPQHLDGAEDYILEHCNTCGDIDDYDYDDDQDNEFPILKEFCFDFDSDLDGDLSDEDININTCKPYLDSLRSYHAKRITSIINPSSTENYIDYTVSSPHGIAGQHFDFQPLNGNGEVDLDNFLLDEERSINTPVVIYVKDGPVRVHGTYKGRYSIVTDVFTAYRRHAWNSDLNGATPIDTIWNNIWLTDDLLNDDANIYGNMDDMQPNSSCRGGSDNSMGLISGANIVIANTQKNGAVNGCPGTTCSQNISGIRINAGLISLNESFVTHYWQNTTHQSGGNTIPISMGAASYNPPAMGYYNSYWDGENDIDYRRWEDYPPWADSRGRVKADSWNENPSNQNDKRGTILLWGGVVQRYRGYVYRNPSSPYNQAWIGYQIKDYNYDENLRCNPPPFYPYIECEGGNGEITIRVTSSKTSKEL